MRRWCANNREKTRSNTRSYRERHPAKSAAAVARARAARPNHYRDLKRNHVQTRRARLLNAVVDVVKRAVVFARDGGICGICRTAVDPTNWHLDHIIPLSRGGEHSYANTQVTHPACNLRKHAHTPEALYA